MNPKVSIIIPVYNRENYIEKCLQSVLNQDYKHIEIIVIDDGSTDSTKEKIKAYENKYKNIKYYYQINSGVSSARNNGIFKSTGEFIIFLDSDDYWDSTLITKEMKKISISNKNLCYCGMLKNRLDIKEVKQDKIRFKQGNIINEFLKEYMNAQTITWLIRKEILLKNSIFFKEGLNYGEDLLFFLKLLSVEECCCVKEYLAFYNMHNDSLTNKIENQLILPDIFDEYKQWLIENKNKIDLDLDEIYKIINSYRIPSNMLRTFFDSIECYDYKLINSNNKLLGGYISDFNMFLGANKMRNILYIMCVKNRCFYKIINLIRKNIRRKKK